MCFTESRWKSEVVQDFKFDYVDVKDFHRTNFGTRFKYMFVYLFILRDIVIYGLDIFTVVTMLSTSNWTNKVYQDGAGKTGTSIFHINVEFNVAKWVFLGCIIFSFLLLGYEVYKAKQVIRSRDISYAFTNVMANDYYSIKDYNNFCLFCAISDSTKMHDKIAFFVFFSFKTWKRTLLADGPRQAINAIILSALFQYVATLKVDGMSEGFHWTNVPILWGADPRKVDPKTDIPTALLFWSMTITVVLFLFSFFSLVLAALLYLPLLCNIQGNLKEYVCHKVDKRLGQIMKRIQKSRIKRNMSLERKIALGGQITNSKGETVDASHLQPTLPSIALEPLKDDKYTAGNYGGRRSPDPYGNGRRSPGPDDAFSSDTHSLKSSMYHGMTPSVKADYALYETYSHDGHSYPPTPGYDEAYGASQTNLLANAAAPAQTSPPLHVAGNVSIPQRAAPNGAPGYPPAPPTPYGAPSYPPTVSQPPPRQAQRMSPPSYAPGGPAAPRLVSPPPQAVRSPPPSIHSPPAHGQFNVAQFSYDAVRQGGGQAHYDYTMASATLPGGAYQVEQVHAFQHQARAPQQGRGPAPQQYRPQQHQHQQFDSGHGW
ncbi:Potassium transporter [Vanrija albida]|uniref:Potassium transporter n=1 Tax=Vanrija albida TaxID=181172 RepID=A0ABR3Q3Y3_9TREE